MGVDAQQIANGVVVLGAVQAPRGHASRIGRRQPVDPSQLALEPGRDGLPLVLGRLRLLVRGHLTVAQLADDFFPAIAVIDERRDRCEGFEVQIAFVLLVAVAGDAVRGEERLDDRLEAVG